jgi:RNA polymerase sigma-70 factor, ECF subfamily
MPDEVSPSTLEGYRGYLTVLARLHVGPRLRARLGASDIVQQTLVQAVASLDGCRARDDVALRAWLRQILGRTLNHARRDHARDKRDVGRERSLHDLLESSSARLEGLLVAEQSSPSECAERRDRLARVAEALEALPAAQREAVSLHYLGGLPIATVAAQLGRSPAAAAGLIQRGLAALRTSLRPAR